MTLLGNEKSFGQVASNNDDLSQICHILFFISFQIQRMTKITRNMSNNVVNVLMLQPKRFLISIIWPVGLWDGLEHLCYKMLLWCWWYSSTLTGDPTYQTGFMMAGARLLIQHVFIEAMIYLAVTSSCCLMMSCSGEQVRFCRMHWVLHGRLLVHVLHIKPTGHFTACLYEGAPPAGAWRLQISRRWGYVGGGWLIRLPRPVWFIDSFVCLFRNLICIIHVERGAVLRTLAG